MKKRATFIAAISAALLAMLVIMTSCGGGAAQTSKNGQTDVKKLPFVTLKIAFPAGNGGMQKDQAAVQAKITEYCKEKLNCDVILNPLDWGVVGDRIPLIVQSGEDIDMVFCPDWLGYWKFVAGNALLPLNDLLAKNGAGILAVLPDVLKQGPKYKGELYGLPCNKDISQGGGLFVTKAMVDKYGFDTSSVKYINDVEPWLQTILDKEPGVCPLFFGTETIDWLGLPTIEAKDEGYVVNYLSGVGFSEKTQKFVPYYETITQKSYYKLIRTWRDKGYINADAGTSQSKNEDEVKAGRAWTIYSTNQPGQLAFWSSAAQQPLVQIDGHAAWVTTPATCSALTVFTKQNKDPDRSMMFMNLLYTDPYFENLCLYGLEGQNYVKMDDGRINTPDGSGDWANCGYNPGTNWEYGNELISYVPYPGEADQWKVLEDYNKTQCKPSAALGFTFDSTAVADQVTACQAITDEYDKILKFGMADVDETYNAMLPRFKDAGLQTVIDEYNKQFQDWKAGK